MLRNIVVISLFGFIAIFATGANASIIDTVAVADTSTAQTTDGPQTTNPVATIMSLAPEGFVRYHNTDHCGLGFIRGKLCREELGWTLEAIVNKYDGGGSDAITHILTPKYHGFGLRIRSTHGNDWFLRNYVGALYNVKLYGVDATLHYAPAGFDREGNGIDTHEFELGFAFPLFKLWGMSAVLDHFHLWTHNDSFDHTVFTYGETLAQISIGRGFQVQPGVRWLGDCVHGTPKGYMTFNVQYGWGN